MRFRALVIDYATPEPEKNAGAYAAVQEMRLLYGRGQGTIVSHPFAVVASCSA